MTSSDKAEAERLYPDNPRLWANSHAPERAAFLKGIKFAEERAPGAPAPADKNAFTTADYAELHSHLMAASDDDVTAILSNNFNVVLGALRVASSTSAPALALWQAWMELNAICARDGVPYTRDGWKASVDESYFCKVKDDCETAYKQLTGKEIQPWHGVDRHTTLERRTVEVAKRNGCDRGTFTVCLAEQEGRVCKCKQHARYLLASDAGPTEGER